jgi:hypothetical protein
MRSSNEVELRRSSCLQTVTIVSLYLITLIICKLRIAKNTNISIQADKFGS